MVPEKAKSISTQSPLLADLAGLGFGLNAANHSSVDSENFPRFSLEFPEVQWMFAEFHLILSRMGWIMMDLMD